VDGVGVVGGVEEVSAGGVDEVSAASGVTVAVVLVPATCSAATGGEFAGTAWTI
jgi:hypothetical protein